MKGIALGSIAFLAVLFMLWQIARWAVATADAAAGALS